MLKKSEFAKLFPCQTFLLYDIMFSLKRSSDTTKELKSETILSLDATAGNFLLYNYTKVHILQKLRVC